MMWTTRLAYISISGLLLISSFGTGSGHDQEPIRLAEQAKPAEAEPLIVKGVRMEFAAIPAGEFTMGCSPGDTECDDDEKPSHRVRITRGFEMGKYEVTQTQWEAVMGSNPSHFKGADRPVERVSWNEIQEYLGKLNAGNDGYR